MWLFFIFGVKGLVWGRIDFVGCWVGVKVGYGLVLIYL